MTSHSSLAWIPASNHRGQNENFFYRFIFRLRLKVCLCQSVALHRILHSEYYMIPTPFRDQLNRLYFRLSAAHRVSDSKISVANTSYLSLKVSWIDRRLLMNDFFEPPITEASSRSAWLTNVLKMLVYSMVNLGLVINPMFGYVAMVLEFCQ